MTASTASFAKCSLSWDKIFELNVVIAIFIKSDLNFSAFQQCQMVYMVREKTEKIKTEMQSYIKNDQWAPVEAHMQ